MASKIEVNLDTSKEIYKYYKCKQNDDLTLIANIFDNGAAKDLTNCSIVIQAKKADKTSVIQNTDIKKLDKKFEANLVRDFTRAPGETLIEVVLVEGGKQNTTFSFILEVDASVIKGAEESKDLITSLEVMQDAVVEMGKISEETKELIKNSGAASKEEINEVNASLAEKASYFENINDMKTSNKIKVNSICKTLGYYNVNDGGGATYRITNNTALENAFSFSVDNGLTAELLYTDEINIKQLGARDFDELGNKVDIKEYVELYLSKTNPIGNATINKRMIKLFIPSGFWFSSPLKLKASSINIYGVNSYSYPYATGTVIMPIEDNQEYLWVIGDNTTESKGTEYGNISIKNLMFSTRNVTKNDGIFAGALTSDKCYSCDSLLVISRVLGGVFDNIHFTNYKGVPLKIMSSSESIFNDFTFRNGDSFENGNVVFDTDIAGNKNISACFFDKFSFEGVKGDLFNFKANSKYINNQIGTIIFEDREVKISKDGTFRNYNVAEDTSKVFTSKSVINIVEQEYCEISIDNILLNNFGRVVFLLGENEYLFDTIVKENGKISKGQVNIKNISHVGARRDTLLLNKSDYEELGSYNFNFTCENVRNVDSDAYKFMIKTSGSMKPFISYKEIGYSKCIDYATSPNVVLTKNGKTGYYMPVVTDNESITNEKLVIDNFQYKKYIPSFSAESSCFVVPVVGNKLHIRVKSKTGFLAHCFLVENPSEYQNKTVKTSEEIYKWHTIDLTSYRETHTDKELKIAIRTLTEDSTNYARLDVFYWE